MNFLRTACTLLIVLASTTIVCHAQQDDYSVQQVRELLKLPVGNSSSVSEKILNRQGDRVSIALMKIYPGDELTNPENVRRYLPMITTAFQALSVVPPDDREPRVTLLLLNSIKGRIQDPQLQASILQTIHAVQKATEMGYSVGQIKELLKLPAGSSTGIEEKILGRLGDRVAIAITKIYTEAELLNPENMRRYLPMLIMAFQAQETTAPEDRQPRVTTVLLEFLKAQTTDSQMQAQVMSTAATVQRESASH